jgi:hypothetical protein
LVILIGRGGEFVSKGATGTDESGQVDWFAVRFAILPATPDDALPFVGECAHGSVKRATFGALLLEVGSGPLAMPNAFPGFAGTKLQGQAVVCS